MLFTNILKKILILIIMGISFVYAYNYLQTFHNSYQYLKMKDYKDAIRVLIPLTKEKGFKYKYYLYLKFGYLYFLRGNYKESLQYYQAAQIIYPSLTSLLGIEKAFLYEGQYNKTIQTGYTILKKDFYNYYGNLYLAYGLFYEKNYSKALEICNKMLALYPDDFSFLEVKQKILLKENKQKEAKEVGEILKIINPI